MPALLDLDWDFLAAVAGWCFAVAEVMAKGDHGFSVSVRGSLNGGYLRPRVQIGFDDRTLQAIKKLARKNDRSFAAEVRVLIAEALVRRGLEP